VRTLIGHRPFSASFGNEPHVWDHSAHIIDFVKAVVEGRGSEDVGSEARTVVSSLKNLVQALESPAAASGSLSSEAKATKHHAGPLMPPVEAAIAVLRWTKGSCAHHETKIMSSLTRT
jgi:hypothetical protein